MATYRSPPFGSLEVYSYSNLSSHRRAAAILIDRWCSRAHGRHSLPPQQFYLPSLSLRVLVCHHNTRTLQGLLGSCFKTSRLKSVGRKLRQHLYSTAYGSPLQPGLQQLQQRGKALLSPTLPAQSGSSAKPPPPERGGDAVKQSLCYPSVCGSWLMPPQGYNTTPAPQGVPGNKPPAPVAAPRTQTDVGVAKA